MAKNVDHLQHVKSSVVNEGKPKLPQANQLVEGELAINYAEGVETISIKNSSGDIVTFSSDNYYTEQKLGSGFTGENSANTVTSVIESNERAISSALNDLEENKLDVSAYTPSVELWVSGTGENSIVQKGTSCTASGACAIAEGSGTTASGNYSHAEGKETLASGKSSHAEGSSTIASGDYSHAEGSYTKASKRYSHAEGYLSEANESYSHAEGWNTRANSVADHAEGTNSIASGGNSHAEGEETQAKKMSSHAEGDHSIANGVASHAEGVYTQANNKAEHASGQFNKSVTASTTFGHSGNTLFSVGNGDTINTRHNAFEIRQNGDIYIVNKNGQDVKLQDEIGNITIDQIIDSGTSASTDAVSTSAVYGFVTSYTPSITVDEVLDDSVSASTNPIASKAVYSALTDTEFVWANAYGALSGLVSSHTINTTIHITASDRDKLDSITGSIGTMAYENASSYSSATEVNTALGNKADASDLSTLSGTVTAHTADTGIHITSAERTEWNAKLDASDIADFFDDAKYEDSGTSKVINFYHGNTVKATINADDFIVDGMISGVTLESKSGTTYLVINWNTDAGIQTTELNIGDIFEADNYYDKTEIDNKLGSAFTGSNSGVTITEYIENNEEVTSAALNDLYVTKLDSSAYTPVQIDQIINGSTSASTDAVSTSAVYGFVTSYTPSITVDPSLNPSSNNPVANSAITAAINSKANSGDVYTKSETSGATELANAFANVHIDIDQVIDSGTSASTDAVSTSAVYGFVTKNFYTKEETDDGDEVISASLNDLNTRKLDESAFTEHASNTSIHLLQIVSAVTVSSDMSNVTCPDSITGASNNGAQALVIYENSGSTTDYTITVSSSYKSPDGSQVTMTCPRNGYCEVSYVNINGTIYVRGI